MLYEVITITVEGGGDMESTLSEIVMAQQGRAHVADADERTFPDAVDSQGLLDRSDELLDEVTDTPHS